MNDTPTTGVAQATPDGELRRQILSQCVAKNEREWWAAGRIEKLEFELNAANDRIQSLIEERDRANRLAEWKWNLRDEFQLLLGTDKIEEGIEAVKELKRRIKRLVEESESRWMLAQSATGSCAEMSSRIKRLEEAGDAVAAIIGPPGSAHWADENQVDAAWNNWLKAKEAKPCRYCLRSNCECSDSDIMPDIGDK